MEIWVEQKPIDEITDCEQRPSCALSFLDLNNLRTSTYRVMRSWVPGWLWSVTPGFIRPLLTKRLHGDLTPASLVALAQDSKARIINSMDTGLKGR